MSRNFVALVKEFENGQPSIVLEPHEEVGLSDNKRIKIEFPEGTTIETAQDVARILNKTAFKIEVRDY